jgi:hypothetical protein
LITASHKLTASAVNIARRVNPGKKRTAELGIMPYQTMRMTKKRKLMAKSTMPASTEAVGSRSRGK